MLAASWLLTIVMLGNLLGYWFALPRHMVDPAWPTHARFHLVQAFLWITGLHAAMLILLWEPLQRQEQWSFWTLLALCIFAQGSHFFAVLALPKGRPPSRANIYDWILGLVLLLYAIGLGWIATMMGLL